MLQSIKLEALHQLVTSSTKDELIWMNGYLAGIIGVALPATAAMSGEKPSGVSRKITIAYGTETGNAKNLATGFAARAKQMGFSVKLASFDQYRPNGLSKEEYLLVVISTQGDGEPPESAKKFYDYIHHDNGRLDKLNYAVLALGDTAYPLFCKAGEDVDQRLHQLGGRRITDVRKCDTDYEETAADWLNNVLQALSAGGPHPNAGTLSPAVTKKVSSKKHYQGTVLVNVNLNDRGSAKQTHHIEIAAEDLDYQPGDSLGIVPENPLAAVNAVLTITQTDPLKLTEYKKELFSVRELLLQKLQIVHLPERVVQKYAGVIHQEIPATRIDLVDLLKIYPVRDAEQFEDVLQILEPIAPRLYSISSSPEAHEGEVHLTVARDLFTVNKQVKYGLCSDHLSQLHENDNVEFYIHKNNQFRLPASDKNVIMIGPGTGIAPFRSFLSEREALGATGENWLFFGDQHFETDFLYQTEIQNWLATGVLSAVNLAFSRDQEEKIYVQHRMLAQAEQLFSWLQNGGFIYVCGAKEPMAVDVENTWLQILQEAGGLTPGGATDYLNALKEEGRYLKDVY